MTARPRPLVMIAATLMLMLAGCEKDESKRLVQMAERHLESQAEQNKRMVELQRDITEGTRQLVEADAKSREEMIALQRDVQAERAEVGQQRDALEEERRALAARRHLDPIIAAAITNVGLIVACLLPLVLCWYLLRRGPEDDTVAVVNEFLIQELVAEQPLLLAPPDNRPALTYREEPATGSDPGDVHDDHN